jgi:hypothetical protein
MVLEPNVRVLARRLRRLIEAREPKRAPAAKPRPSPASRAMAAEAPEGGPAE